jgi:hypothetical protein
MGHRSANPGRIMGVNYNQRQVSPKGGGSNNASGSLAPTQGGQGNSAKLGRGQSVQQVPIQVSVSLVSDTIVRIQFEFANNNASQPVIVAGTLDLHLVDVTFTGDADVTPYAQTTGDDNTYIQQYFHQSVSMFPWSVTANAFAIQNKSGGGIIAASGILGM